MMDGNSEWGDFSKWLNQVDQDLSESNSQATCSSSFEKLDDDVSLSGLVDSLKDWLQKLEDAPKTTWLEELSVRGYDYDYDFSYTEEQIHVLLKHLIESLAGMRVFLTNTDHLDDQALYRLLLNRYLVQSVAQIPFDNKTGCVIDIVGTEIQDDPTNWLRYYANNCERMEWAKQNVGRELPPTEEPPFIREHWLPKP